MLLKNTKHQLLKGIFASFSIYVLLVSCGDEGSSNGERVDSDRQDVEIIENRGDSGFLNVTNEVQCEGDAQVIIDGVDVCADEDLN